MRTRPCSSGLTVKAGACDDARVKRDRAYEEIAAVLHDWFSELGWTPELVAETEQRIAVDDADVWDPSVAYVDFALRVLDRLSVVSPYEGPGDLRR